MVIDGRTFRFEVGSDVIRDGMFLEAWESAGNDLKQVAEAFYSDATGQLVFSAFTKNLPDEVSDYMNREARVRLIPVSEIDGAKQ